MNSYRFEKNQPKPGPENFENQGLTRTETKYFSKNPTTWDQDQTRENLEPISLWTPHSEALFIEIRHD